MTTRIVKSNEALLGSFRTHLLSTCGVTQGTCDLFTWHISKFLADRVISRGINSRSLKPSELIRYISSLAPRYRPNTRKSAVSAVRSFLRWLQLTGQCDAGLNRAVPTVSSTRRSDVPIQLSAAELASLLGAFDRGCAHGLRGYAATLCMVRLGLRIGEVARITLDDIDWRAGTLRIPRGKCRCAKLLPLSWVVGKAIVEYLRKGRPSTACRHVFLSCRGPGTPAGITALRWDVRRAFESAGLNVPSKGTRVLRHTAATNLIQKGVTLKAIADVLGHRSIDTTVIYTKVDLTHLREVALPWPEVEQ